MKAVHIISFIILVVGGLNWGLVGIGGESWNVVAFLGDGIARIVYILVGLAAIEAIVMHKKSCKECTSAAPSGVGTM